MIKSHEELDRAGPQFAMIEIRLMVEMIRFYMCILKIITRGA